MWKLAEIRHICDFLKISSKISSQLAPRGGQRKVQCVPLTPRGSQQTLSNTWMGTTSHVMGPGGPCQVGVKMAIFARKCHFVATFSKLFLEEGTLHLEQLG